MQPTRIAALLLLATCVTSAAADHPANLIKDGDFQRQDFALSTRDEPGAWVLRNHGADRASVDIVSTPEPDNARCLKYHNTDAGSHNIHVDQLVPVEPNTVYDVRARVRGDGNLEPLIAVQTKDWANLVIASCGGGTDWSEIRLCFHSFDNDVVRLEWFPGAQGKLYTGVAGTSWLDNVTLRPIENPSPGLLTRVLPQTTAARPGD